MPFLLRPVHGLCGTRKDADGNEVALSEGSVMRDSTPSQGLAIFLLTDEAIGVRIVEALEQRYDSAGLC